MTVSSIPRPSRRTLVTWMAAAAVLGTTLQSQANGRGRGGTDPSDRIPRHYSLKKFLSLSQPQVYEINHASRAGRRITIQGFSPSESRELLRNATRDWPATRRTLQQTQG